MLGELWRRLWYLLNRSRFERELREEMAAHRDMMGARGGEFGNALRLREASRDEWGWAWLDRLSQDLGFACRLLWRAPGFTLTAIAVLAVGIGLNLAAFQFIDRLALSWRPVRSPETLVNLQRRSPTSITTSFSYPAFDFYRRNGRSLAAGLGLVNNDVSLGGTESRHVGAEFVTGNYFSELGALPAAGRLLHGSDDVVGAAPVIVLSERLWKSAYGGETAIVGRPVEVNGHQFTVVGIVPDNFVGLDDRAPAAWMPIAQHQVAFPGSTLLEDWNADSVRFYARLRQGVTTAAAEEELRAAVNALRTERPDNVLDNEWLELRPAGKFVRLDEAAPALALITSLVGLVLIAACVNLGLLVLARTLGRQREFAIRLSVGATRGRIIRQLLTEHLLLGFLGALAGCLVAVYAARAGWLLSGAPAGLAPALNLRAVVVAALLAVFASVVFGFGPAWQALRPAAVRRVRLRGVLVGMQVAAATALLILSGLLVRGVTRVVSVPLGFDYQQTLVADPALASHGVLPAAAQAYWHNVDERIRALPEVRNVALTTLAPLGGRVAINSARTVFYNVTPAYFDALQIDLKRGRIFGDGEAGVVVISETLARRRWPDDDALGKTYGGATVIGVVGDARTVKLSENAATECYSPIETAQLPEAAMVVRVDGSPAVAATHVRSVMRGIDTRMMPSVVPLEDALQAKLDGPRRFAFVTSTLGVCALLLAVTGLGGLVAFTVSQRLREIGVRLALGARPSHIVRAVARQFTTPVVCGAVAGSGLAAAAGMLLSSELFGVSGLDPLAHGGAAVLFAVVSIVAALPSLRRAIRVDPIQTLRHE